MRWRVELSDVAQKQLARLPRDVRDRMERAIDEIEGALAALGKPSPWGPDLKVSDEFLGPLFEKFFVGLGLPNLLSKIDYYRLAHSIAPEALDAEVRAKLDWIVETAGRARPRVA